MTHKIECSTKAKRGALRDRLFQLADERGAEAHGWERRREITVTITLGPYAVNVDLDGDSAMNGFLGHWHQSRMKLNDPIAEYDAGFGVAIGSLGHTPHHKATSYALDFDGLYASLDKGLRYLQATLPA